VSRPAKLAAVRYYVDADVLGLAKILVQVRGDITYPGDLGATVRGGRVRPPCPITTPATLDQVWIPETARRGWLIITRDRHIQDHEAEVAAVRDHGARMIALAAKEATTTWHQLETVLCQWRSIERLSETPGPFIYTATRTALRPVLAPTGRV